MGAGVDYEEALTPRLAAAGYSAEQITSAIHMAETVGIAITCGALTPHGYAHPLRVQVGGVEVEPAYPPSTPPHAGQARATRVSGRAAHADSQPLTPTALAQPDPPTLDAHSTLGSGTPGGREAGSGKAASSTTDPDQPHDPTV